MPKPIRRGRPTVAALVLALLGGCATGPTVYQRAYDYCRQNGGQDYECDRFARDEADHAQQQIADQLRRGQDAVADPARPSHLRRNQPLPLCSDSSLLRHPQRAVPDVLRRRPAVAAA